MQPYRLFQAEEEVHVVDCLAARSLQQVVYHRNDQQLVFLFQQIDQALVRIYHLFQIRVLVGDESERVIRSHLLQMRGLKPLFKGAFERVFNVASFTGTTIYNIFCKKITGLKYLFVRK